jgi:hypothetical protein
VNKNILIALGVGVAAGAAGWFVGYRMGKASELNRADREIEEMKDLYARRNKAEKFATPEDALRELHGQEAVEEVEQYLEEARNYQERPLEGEIFETGEPDDEPTPFTIEGQTPDEYFATHPQHQNVWDAVIDIDTKALEERGTGVPYVITIDEYQEEEQDYDKITLVYYEDDEVLVDDHDDRVDNLDYTVGPQNLHRFGMGSNDKKTVFVRNDRREADYEIVLNEGSYSEIVLGVKIPSSKSRPGKMRDDE